jgi:hypothetical protein
MALALHSWKSVGQLRKQTEVDHELHKKYQVANGSGGVGSFTLHDERDSRTRN